MGVRFSGVSIKRVPLYWLTDVIIMYHASYPGRMGGTPGYKASIMHAMWKGKTDHDVTRDY